VSIVNETVQHLGLPLSLPALKTLQFKQMTLVLGGVVFLFNLLHVWIQHTFLEPFQLLKLRD